MKKLVYTIIKDQEQYDKYCEILEQLVNAAPSIAEDEINLLSLLISDYNQRVMEQFNHQMDPVELLQDFIQENNMSQLQLANKIGVSPQLLNDVLKYRREITKKLAYRLSAEFKLKYSAFLKPYRIKKAS
jgi:HTH-type transcriptional regulator/antitoxin HigA